MIHAESSVDSPSRDHAEATPPPTEEIVGGIANVFRYVNQVFADLFRLFSLEVHRVGLTLMWMVTLGAMAAMLMVTAWLGLMAALLLWAVSLGLTWVSAIVVMALVNLVMAAIVMFFSMHLSQNLLFPATRRQIDPDPPRVAAS